MNEQRTAQPPAAAGLLYTALQLSRGLRVTPQAIRNRLANVLPDGQMLASGNLTAAWRLESLPAGLLSELEQGAQKAGYHLVDHFLRAEPAPQPREPKPPVILTRPSDERFRDLLTVLQAIRDPSAPSLADRAFVWGQAVGLYQALGPGRKLKRDLLRFLKRHAPWLARNYNALRVAFERRLKNPAALTDRRPEKNAKRRLELGQVDRNVLERTAVLNWGGRIAPAWRQCRDEGILSPALINRYITNPARTEHVPGAVRREISHETKILHSFHKSPRQCAQEGNWVDRNWDNVFAGDAYQGDDKTPDVYFWIPNEEGWEDVIRGQFLPFIDVRSKRILVGPLLASKSYNAFDVRTAMTKACRLYGVPRRFDFEGGLWKNALIIKGLPASAVSWPETVGAFERLGVKFCHRKNPNGKVIENVLASLQHRMRGEPHYCGRDEKADKHERVQKALQDVRAKRLHGWEAGFYSFEQWSARLTRIVDDYNSTPQQGSKLTKGLSPNAAWQEFQNPEPPIKLDARCEAALANQCFPVKVSRGGRIHLPIKKDWVYASPDTRLLVGREFLALIDSETPEVITLKDPGGKILIAVPRWSECDAYDDEDIGSTLALIAEGRRRVRTRYLEIKAGFIPPARVNLVSRETEEENRVIAEQRGAILKQESARVRRKRRLYQGARKVGLNLGALNPNPDQALEALDNLPRHLAALDREGDA